MTAQSSINKSNFAKYFFYKLGRLKMVGVFVTLLSFCTYPLVGVIANIYSKVFVQYNSDINRPLSVSQSYSDVYSIYYMAEWICFFALLIVGLTGFKILLTNFRWLYKKKCIDMDMVLPVGTTTRFFADFLSGLLVYMVPQIICAIIGGSLISKAGNYVQKSGIDVSMDLIYGHDVIILGLIFCVMFYCFSLLIVSLCSRTAEAKIWPIAMEIIIYLFLQSSITLFNSFYGSCVTDMFDDVILNSIIVKSMTPLGLAFSVLGSGIGVYYGDLYRILDVVFSDATVVLLPLFCIIYVLVAYFIVKKRRNERVGKPFPFGFVKHFFLGVSVFTIVALYFNVYINDYNQTRTVSIVTMLIYCIITTAILFFAIDISVGQKLKKLHMTLIRYVVTFISSVILCIIIIFAGGIGNIDYAPDSEDIDKAYVSVFAHKYGYDYYTASLSGEVSNFDVLIDLNKEIVSNRSDYTDEDCCEVYIRYSLKNGEKIERRYVDIPYGYMKTAFSKAIEAGVTQIVDPGITYNDDYTEEQILKRNVYMSMPTLYNKMNVMTGEVVTDAGDMRLTSIPGEELWEALKKDYEQASFETLYDSSYRLISYVTIEDVLSIGKQACYQSAANENGYPIYSYPVYSYCTNALAILEKYQQTDGYYIEQSLIGDGVKLSKFANKYKLFMRPEFAYGEDYYYGLKEVDEELMFVNSKNLELGSDVLNEIIGYCAPEVYAEGYENEDAYVVSIISDNDVRTELLVRPVYNDRVAEIFASLGE